MVCWFSKSSQHTSVNWAWSNRRLAQVFICALMGIGGGAYCSCNDVGFKFIFESSVCALCGIVVWRFLGTLIFVIYGVGNRSCQSGRWAMFICLHLLAFIASPGATLQLDDSLEKNLDRLIEESFRGFSWFLVAYA